MNFNTKNANFTGVIQVDTSIAKPTVIYASEYFFYTKGATVTLKDESGAVIPTSDYTQTKIRQNYIGIQVTNAKYNGKKISINVVPVKSADDESHT